MLVLHVVKVALNCVKGSLIELWNINQVSDLSSLTGLALFPWGRWMSSFECKFFLSWSSFVWPTSLWLSFCGYHISPALQGNAHNRFFNLLLRRIFETFSLLRSWILHRSSVCAPLQRDVEEQLRLACQCVFSSFFFCRLVSYRE